MKPKQKQSWPVPPNSQMAIRRHEYWRAKVEGLPVNECSRRAEWAAECAQKFGLDLAGWLQYTGQM